MNGPTGSRFPSGSGAAKADPGAMSTEAPSSGTAASSTGLYVGPAYDRLRLVVLTGAGRAPDPDPASPEGAIFRHRLAAYAAALAADARVLSYSLGPDGFPPAAAIAKAMDHVALFPLPAPADEPALELLAAPLAELAPRTLLVLGRGPAAGRIEERILAASTITIYEESLVRVFEGPLSRGVVRGYVLPHPTANGSTAPSVLSSLARATRRLTAA